jgi:hypothetical protein
MVTLVKHEWHQVDRQYAFEVDIDLLAEIYPDMKKKELKQRLKELESEEYSIEDLIEDACQNDVEIEWEQQYEDCWTDRKGGYDVTYEVGDEHSWHKEPEPPAPTHKCTKCKWEGQSYDAEWIWEDLEGNHIDDPRKVCPYCESEVALTEAGIKEAEEKAKWLEEFNEDWEKHADDTELDEDVLALEEALREADKIGLTEVLPQEWPFEDPEPETKSKKKKKK